MDKGDWSRLPDQLWEQLVAAWPGEFTLAMVEQDLRYWDGRARSLAARRECQVYVDDVRPAVDELAMRWRWITKARGQHAGGKPATKRVRTVLRTESWIDPYAEDCTSRRHGSKGRRRASRGQTEGRRRASRGQTEGRTDDDGHGIDDARGQTGGKPRADEGQTEGKPRADGGPHAGALSTETETDTVTETRERGAELSLIDLDIRSSKLRHELEQAGMHTTADLIPLTRAQLDDLVGRRYAGAVAQQLRTHGYQLAEPPRPKQQLDERKGDELQVVRRDALQLFAGIYSELGDGSDYPWLADHIEMRRAGIWVDACSVRGDPDTARLVLDHSIRCWAQAVMAGDAFPPEPTTQAFTASLTKWVQLGRQSAGAR